MSRSLWRCHNPACGTPHGAVLGRVTSNRGLILDPAVMTFRCYLDTRRVMVVCPSCGTSREFRGSVIMSAI